MSKYKKHIFICTNDKENGKKCCTADFGLQLINSFRENSKELEISNKDIRIQRSGCLGVCSNGPALVVYPEGVFYGKVTLDDVKEITESHIKNDKFVERLKLDFE